MEYIILLAIVTTIFIFFLFPYLNKHASKKKIEQIRASWGNAKTDSFHFEGIKKYADAVNKNSFHRLTNQTVEDIDFYQLFAFIDRTTSRVGQQFLFKKIIEPTNNIEDPCQRLITLFATNINLREEIQLELLNLTHNDAYHISSLLSNRLTEKPKWFKLMSIYIVIVAFLCILIVKFPILISILPFVMMLNMFLHYWSKSKAFQYATSIPQLDLLIKAAKRFTSKGDLFNDKSVAASIVNLKSFQQKASLVNFENGSGVQADVASYFFELIKIFTLLEVFMLFKVLKEVQNKQSDIITLFNYVGNIDASISIASLRAGPCKTCLPVLVASEKRIVATNIYHPLIENCIKNNLLVDGKGILITGSNMSGKSTFLRTMIINSVLAQTIYTCFADEYSSPVLKQFSSIRISDNLLEGKSYYFQEVNTMSSLIAEVQTSNQNLFVLDEVFKGTNTVERIAAAKAILSYLNRGNNIVIVSTHDIELADMLKNEYDLYHFTEMVENNELYFDHTIKPGPVSTRNAINILELRNYPVEIIDEARQISNAL